MQDTYVMVLCKHIDMDTDPEDIQKWIEHTRYAMALAGVDVKEDYLSRFKEAIGMGWILSPMKLDEIKSKYDLEVDHCVDNFIFLRSK